MLSGGDVIPVASAAGSSGPPSTRGPVEYGDDVEPPLDASSVAGSVEGDAELLGEVPSEGDGTTPPDPASDTVLDTDADEEDESDGSPDESEGPDVGFVWSAAELALLRSEGFVPDLSRATPLGDGSFYVAPLPAGW